MIKLHIAQKINGIKASVVAIVMAALAVSCSTTRLVPDDDQLYTGINKIVFNEEEGVSLSSDLKSEVREAVFVEPNNYWSLVDWRYPFPLGLWVYNNWSNPEKGFRHWLYEKLVEEPVLVSDVRPEVRTRMVEQIMDNNGYLRATGTYELIPGKNPKKASIRYNINPGPAFVYHSVELLPDTSELNRQINSLARELPYLRPGSRYSTDSLSAVRVSIANSLRNIGYYYFQPEYIEYLADSIAHPGSIDLRMTLGANIPRPLLEPYRTGRVNVYVYRNQRRGTKVDTINTPNFTIYAQNPIKMRRGLIRENVTFRPGQIFSVSDMDLTQSYLARLGIFSSVNIEPQADSTSIAARTLNVDVSCVMDKPLEASIEVNASSKSNSYIGPGLLLSLTHCNMFGGGEQLSVSLNGSYEWQTGSDNSGGIFNSYEAGITASLAVPRLLAPKFVPRKKTQVNWTRFTLNADLLNRPHFFKMAQFNMSMEYDWRNSRWSTMSLTPFKLTYTKLMHTTAEFDSIMAANPAVALSFQSQFIPQMQYGYTLDHPIGTDNNLSMSFALQQAGNVFWSIYELCGNHGDKKLFGTPFSQFVKGQMQVVYSRRLGRADSWLVTRAMVGAAHAYGNSSQVPYAEQFYCGGANSVRAFTVRSLGPGSYHVPGDNSSDYFDQTGTFKFEANMEWRFPIAGPLHGALFVDAGNVWLLKADELRPGGQLKASTFLRDLALGTGVGLRFDISMLVVRGDLGIGIHAPYDTGKSGYYNMTSFGKSLAFHLAIGYPF